MAGFFVRFPRPTAFVAARFAVVPARALRGAGFRFVDRLDLDLDAVSVLLVSRKADMRIAMLGATSWPSNPAPRGVAMKEI